MRFKQRLVLFALLVVVSASCVTQPAPETHDAVVQAPQRIVSISPSVTEILYGVGAWPQVVAVSQFCSYPEDVKNKPRVNGWEKTNLEQLTGLKPDLVIGVAAQAPFLQDKLTELGIR
ncbi:MAG TPA: helical backbone metal receptor, partial [Pyrinomonadaceae bacterium]|nr:helical backbone metal receptor [Pyrinomonadaceae bacterium]